MSTHPHLGLPALPASARAAALLTALAVVTALAAGVVLVGLVLGLTGPSTAGTPGHLPAPRPQSAPVPPAASRSEHGRLATRAPRPHGGPTHPAVR